MPSAGDERTRLTKKKAGAVPSGLGIKYGKQAFRGVTGKSILKGVAMEREFVGLAPIFERLFKPLYGQPCWGVRPGIRPTLTLEFGKPHLVVRQPIVASPEATDEVRTALRRRRVYPHGEWHLWIYCCHWRALANGTELAWSESSREQIAAAANEIDDAARTPPPAVFQPQI